MKNIYFSIMSILLALLGGMASYLRDSASFKCYDFFRRSMISIFTGCISYLICTHFGVSPYLTGAITGIAGYAGTEYLDYIWFLIKNSKKGE